MSRRILCPLCGDVLGVYEPLLVAGGCSLRVSSLAREPSLLASDDVIVHRACGASPGAAEEPAVETFRRAPS